MTASETSGWIFDVQGFSLHDGPGTRTTVFLLGCPLRCRWCSNPEGLFARPRLLFKPARCARPVTGCTACLDVCPSGKIRADAGSGAVRVDRPALPGALASPLPEHPSAAAPAAVARPLEPGSLTDRETDPGTGGTQPGGAPQAGTGRWPVAPAGTEARDGSAFEAGPEAGTGGATPETVGTGVSTAVGFRPFGGEGGMTDGCTGCAAPCVDACPHEALTLGGRSVRASDLQRILNRDRRFWGNGGGVTFSGGEPLGQPAFLLEMLRWCRGHGIHAALETSAFARPEVFREALGLVEFAFLDLKVMDPARHRDWTGVDNQVILENVRSAAARNSRPRLVVRVPLIAGVNDDPGNLETLARFMAEAGLDEVNLLPFHAMGTTKWQHCGLDSCQTGLRAPDQAGMDAAAELLRRGGRTVYLGHETPF
ncbi:MAG: glycyl-radical enzyme activating protein [Candidatus Riflebacteria bacterium]|nr:glycyl-radical enzyme activating protein [Candidatus Riflebacteria bacterium]